MHRHHHPVTAELFALEIPLLDEEFDMFEEEVSLDASPVLADEDILAA